MRGDEATACGTPRPSSRPSCCRNNLNDLLFREACSSRVPSGFLKAGRSSAGVALFEPLQQRKVRPAARASPPLLSGSSFAARIQCLGGLLLLLRTNVESSKRKMKVHVADRRVLMPDHDLFGFPGKKASEDRVSIVIWRDADPVAGLEAGILTR